MTGRDEARSATDTADERQSFLRLLGENLGREMEARDVSMADLAVLTGSRRGASGGSGGPRWRPVRFEVLRLATRLGAAPEDLVGDLWGDFAADQQHDRPAETGRADERTREE